jgi:hypothetical protein
MKGKMKLGVADGNSAQVTVPPGTFVPPVGIPPELAPAPPEVPNSTIPAVAMQAATIASILPSRIRGPSLSSRHAATRFSLPQVTGTLPFRDDERGVLVLFCLGFVDEFRLV